MPMGSLTSLLTRNKRSLLLLKRQQSIYRKQHPEGMQQLRAIIKKTQRKIHPSVKVVERKSQNLFVLDAQTVGIAVENISNGNGVPGMPLVKKSRPNATENDL